MFNNKKYKNSKSYVLPSPNSIKINEDGKTKPLVLRDRPWISRGFSIFSIDKLGISFFLEFFLVIFFDIAPGFRCALSGLRDYSGFMRNPRKVLYDTVKFADLTALTPLVL